MRTRVVLVLAVAALAGLAEMGALAASSRQGAAGPVPAQPVRPLPTLVVEVQGMYTPLKTNLTKSADLFPEDKYDWRPTPAVRTWAGLFGHVIDDNYGFCSPLIGETRPPALDNDGQPTDAAKGLKKADIVRLLADSFARCDKAFTVVTADNMLERASPTSSRSKIGALIYSVQHISEHYGNAVTYMRLNGIVPPSSAMNMGRGRGQEAR
jgi:hypothetical protein